MLRTPSFPAAQLDTVREEMLAALEGQLQDPSQTATATLSQLTSKWPKGDPRYPMLPAERIDEVKRVQLAELKQFYKDFASADHGELVVVGDFDPAQIAAQIEKVCAGWTTKKPYVRLETKAWGVPGQQKSVVIKDKEMTTLAMAEDVAMRDTDPDYPAWLMLSQVVGGGASSRAWMRLREHEGLSYTVETWATADADDPVGEFGGYAIVAPQNLAKAKASMLDEIQKAVGGSFSNDELEHAKGAWLHDQDTNLSSDEYVLQLLGDALFHGRTTAYAQQLRAKIRAVTTADVARVAKKWLDPKRLTIVDAGDTAKVH
jgi:zinc protease